MICETTVHSDNIYCSAQRAAGTWWFG